MLKKKPKRNCSFIRTRGHSSSAAQNFYACVRLARHELYFDEGSFGTNALRAKTNNNDTQHIAPWDAFKAKPSGYKTSSMIFLFQVNRLK